MSELGEGGEIGETTFVAPETRLPASRLSVEGIGSARGLQEGQPEVTDTAAESTPATPQGTETPTTLQAPEPLVAGGKVEKQFAPPGTGGSGDEALAKERPSQVMTPKGISSMQGKNV